MSKASVYTSIDGCNTARGYMSLACWRTALPRYLFKYMECGHLLLRCDLISSGVDAFGCRTVSKGDDNAEFPCSTYQFWYSTEVTKNIYLLV